MLLVAAAAAIPVVSADGRQAPRPLPDQNAFLAEARARLRSDNMAQGRYIHTERETKRERNSKGEVTKTTVRLIEVYPSPEPRLTYRREIFVDGVTPGDLADKDRRFRERALAWIAARAEEGMTPVEAAQKKRAIEEIKERAVIEELPLVFDFRMLGREDVDGRPAIVFAVEPKPRSNPKTREAGIIKHFAGKIWIDEREYELVRAHMESVDAVTYGWGIVARLSKGAIAHFERRKRNDEAWLPTYAHFQATGRVMIFKRMQMDQTSEYFNYRKAEGGGITTFPLQTP